MCLVDLGLFGRYLCFFGILHTLTLTLSNCVLLIVTVVTLVIVPMHTPILYGVLRILIEHENIQSPYSVLRIS